MQLPATGTVYQWVEECGSYWKFVKTSLGVPPQHFELPASSAKGKSMQKNIVWKQKIQGHCSSEKLPEHLDCCRFTFKGLVNPCPQTYQFCLWQMQKNILSSYLAHVDRKVYGNMQVLNDMKKLRILRAFLVQQTTWSRFNED